MTVQSFRDAAMARDLLALRLLIVAFFLSGTGALIYQVIWQRMLGLFAGADSTSAALVVGAFLLGLGIGSLIASYLADRLTPRRAHLRWPPPAASPTPRAPSSPSHR